MISLCKTLKSSYKIRTENFLGHSDIAPLRKVDPGEKFPWKNLSKFQFGYWHKIGKNSLNYSKDKAVFSKISTRSVIDILKLIKELEQIEELFGHFNKGIILKMLQEI